MNKQSHNFFLVSPYNFLLACIFMALLLLGDSIILSIWFNNTRNLSISMALTTGDAFGSYLLLILTLFALLILFNGYEYWGVIKILDDRILLRAPFRRQIMLMYEDINDVGIDYGSVSGTKQFWIFLSKSSVDKKYTHNILRMPFDRNTIRLQYQKKLYDTLVYMTPYKLIGKKLLNAYSIIRIYGADT